MSFPVLLLAFVSATIPVLAWFSILGRKNKKGMWGRFLITFALSGIGGFIVSLFQNDIIEFFSYHSSLLFLVLLLIGASIEYFKNFIVRIIGSRFFQDIDDVIDLSFASALGFTFTENIVEFSITFSGNNPDVVGPIKMLKYFLIREFFILPIHLFTSGIFGYFYGVAIFASDTFKKQNMKNIFFRIPFSLFSFLPGETFKIVKIFQGTILSIFLYGTFFMLYQQNPMVSDLLEILHLPKIPVDEQLIILIAFVFFKFGTVLFFTLMDRKRRLSSQGLLVEIQRT
jgi:RsiW-degrading membrane proteinase PrsW (M82 family)